MGYMRSGMPEALAEALIEPMEREKLVLPAWYIEIENRERQSTSRKSCHEWQLAAQRPGSQRQYAQPREAAAQSKARRR